MKLRKPSNLINTFSLQLSTCLDFQLTWDMNCSWEICRVESGMLLHGRWSFVSTTILCSFQYLWSFCLFTNWQHFSQSRKITPSTCWDYEWEEVCSNITQDSVYVTDGLDLLMDQFRTIAHQDFRGNKCCKWIRLERKLVNTWVTE